MRLREAGKRVVGIGAKQTPAAFSSACDRFTFVEVLESADPGTGSSVEMPQAPEEAADPPAPDSSQPAGKTPTAGEVPELREMLSSAVVARQDEDGWALLSNVGWQLVSNHPTFDSRNYGYERLGQLVRDQDYLEVKKVPGPNGNQVLYV